jgi:hypothetical protein
MLRFADETAERSEAWSRRNVDERGRRPLVQRER